MSNNKRTINFIGIGTVKSATSWVFQCIKEHPEADLPDTKELKFFNREEEYSRGMDYYFAYFKACDPNKITGEFTPRYLYDTGTVARIKKYLPDVKLIVCLRNPIDRAISHVNYAKRKGTITANTFNEAIQKRKDFIDWGQYYKYIKPVYNYYKPEQILVLISEEVFSNKPAHIKKIYNFLNLDENYVPPCLQMKKNETKDIAYRFIRINRFIAKLKQRLRKSSSGIKFLAIIKRFKLNAIATKILYWNKRLGKKNNNMIQLTQKERVELYNYFKTDIQKLETLINKDLSIWKMQ